MITKSAFDFIVDRDKKTITVKREFPAKLSLVWDAYTKSEILDQWWAPKPWKARTKKMDFREGGQWVYAMVGPEGQEHWAVVDYTSIQPRKKFTGRDAFADAEGNINKELPQATWEIKFTDNGNSTLVECLVTYDDLAQLETIIKMGFKEGMEVAMQGLEDLLSSKEIA